jgi:hypothetical protein
LRLSKTRLFALLAITQTIWVFGLLAFGYEVLILSAVCPECEHSAVAHIFPFSWVRQDTFAILCFGGAAVAFLLWSFLRRLPPD